MNETYPPWQGFLLSFLIGLSGLWLILDRFYTHSFGAEYPAAYYVYMAAEILLAFFLFYMATAVRKGKMWAAALSLALSIFFVLGFGSHVLVEKSLENDLVAGIIIAFVVFQMGLECVRHPFYKKNVRP